MILVLLILIVTVLPYKCFADELDEENNEELSQYELNRITQTSAEVNEEPSINSRAAVVIDRSSKCILYSKNANEKRAMASTTKIMTAIIALENSNLNQTITVSKTAANVRRFKTRTNCRG